MNSFLKIALGFVLGVVGTIGVSYFIALNQNAEEDQLREEIRAQVLKNFKQSLDGTEIDKNEQRNIQSFELTIEDRIVKLHTYMLKDSVQMLMGRPQSTDIMDGYNGEITETWRYRGSNTHVDEFTITFSNAKLKSVRQFKDH